jgi:hypothetical protein
MCSRKEALTSKWRIMPRDLDPPGPAVSWHAVCSRNKVRSAWSAVPPRHSHPARPCSTDVRMTMLWTLFVVLLLLWLLGVVSSYTLGGFIHVLLVLAVVAVLVQLISGRRAV